MPNLNPLNLICPVCGDVTRKNGFNPDGEQRYRCRCGWSHGGSKARGRPTILKGRKLTNTERVKRSVKKKKRLEKLLDTLLVT